MIADPRRSRLLTLLVTLVLAFGSIGVAQLEAVIATVLDSGGATLTACPDLVVEIAVEAEISEVICAAVADESSLVADVDHGLFEVSNDDWLSLEFEKMRLVFHPPSRASLLIFIVIAEPELPEFTGLVLFPFGPP